MVVTNNPETILIVLPVPLYSVDGTLFYDTQACNGLRLWLENFDRVILCNPVLTASTPPESTRDIVAMFKDANLDLRPLPTAWTPVEFARKLPATRALLRTLIRQATHLQFAIGGLWGDWGAVAAILAANDGRKAAIWTDRVESNVMRFQAAEYSGARRAYRTVTAWLASRLEHYVIRRSSMGLFHGMDTYRAYAPSSRSAHLVHNIHLGPEARISADDLAAKMARGPDRTVRIVYAGRVHRDKGVSDWIDTLALLADRKIPIEATWYGDGPELAFARDKVRDLALESAIRFVGSVNDRDTLMRAFRDADIFLFCHKTLESPRCLIEALLSGTPIVGYDSPYPRDLIQAHGGGVLVAGEPVALADAVTGIIEQPRRLAELAEAAARDGHPLIDEEVFRHRSDLIKSLLAPSVAAA
ncbi:glycosyltransferase [Sphingomonas aliaeris]|uniref:Glycosyltransferase n=1 Tax=Sphingomonas aliaeris TaxID=2759526 RepID=A0A974S5M2_9SPHN|nr:glycosyltransferase [Sphingomonas aliaeris]